MSEEKLRHPFRRIRAALHKIRDRRLRGLVSFALMFAVSLLVGRLVETIVDEKNLLAAETAQIKWIRAVEAFTPFSLARGYIDDMSPALSGHIIYHRPKEEEAAGVLPADRISAAKIAECNMARLGASSFGDCASLRPAGVSASGCLVSPETEGCAAYQECMDKAGRHFGETPAGCEGVSDAPLSAILGLQGDAGAGGPIFPTEEKPIMPSIFGPFVALIRTASRLIAEGGVVALMQLGLGALCFVVFVRDKNGAVGFGEFPSNLIGGPIFIIGFASLSAFALKWLMIGALSGFHWATSLAAAAAGASGLAGFCWYCFAKLGEKGLEGALTGGA